MGQFQDFSRDPYGFNILDIYNNAAAAASFSAQYQAVYDSFIVKPAADIAQQQDIMVRALVTAGVWAKEDAFYITANNDRANSLINWILPGTFDLVEVNGPINFVAYRGFTGDGINQELNTQYTPSLHATNYALNDSSWGAYSRTALIDVNCIMGANGAADNFMFPDTGGAMTLRHNDATSDVMGAVANSQGLFVANRPAPGTKGAYRNAALIGGVGTAATGLPNVPIHLLSRGGSAFTTRQIAMAYMSGSLDEAGNSEITNLTNTVEIYMDYIGAGVI